jgi:hypothetical protein
MELNGKIQIGITAFYDVNLTVIENSIKNFQVNDVVHRIAVFILYPNLI